jgi:hypothetical protein
VPGCGDAVEVVVGRAGSGKTYALAAAAEIWRDAGYRPMGLGLAARAAHELGRRRGSARIQTFVPILTERAARRRLKDPLPP